MSDQARAYVQKFSPYSGATFAVHYMIGDVANAEYEYRFFMATSNLAAKARVSFKSAQRALDQLCEDGFLVELKSSTQHAPTEYRFIFAKEKPVTYDPPKWASVDEIQTGQGDHPDEIGRAHV